MDSIVDLIHVTAFKHISAVNVIPPFLKCATIRDLHTLIESAAPHLQYEANWVQARHPLPPADPTMKQRTDYLDLLCPQLATSIRDNRRLQEIINACLSTFSPADALSVIMRLWAGCLAAAKILRGKAVGNGGRTEEITPDVRGLRMQDIDTTARIDSIYALAVPVGPYAKRHKRQPEPETVVYTGISEELQRRYFLDDIRENPTSPGAVTA
jgi:hypothetical protein